MPKKITEDDVKAIREQYAAGGSTYVTLSQEYGITPAAVGHIVSGRSWKHVEAAGMPSSRVRRGAAQWNAVMTEEKVREIRARYAAGGVYQHDLGDEFGVSKQAIAKIVNRDNWKHVA